MKSVITKLDDSILLLLRIKALSIPELRPRFFSSEEDLIHYIYSNTKSENNSYFDNLESDIALTLPDRAKPRKECAVKKETVWQVVKSRLNYRRKYPEEDAVFLCNIFGAKDIIDLKANAIHIHFPDNEKVSPADVKTIAQIFGSDTWASLCHKTDKVVVSSSLLKRLYGKINGDAISETILDSVALYLSGKHWEEFAKDRRLQDDIKERLVSCLVNYSSLMFEPSKTFYISYLLEDMEEIEIFYDDEGKNFLRLCHMQDNDFKVLEATSQRLCKGDIITVLQFEVGGKFIGHVRTKVNGIIKQTSYQSRTITKLRRSRDKYGYFH